MCGLSLQTIPQVMFSVEDMILRITQAAIVGIQLQHREANRSILRFLDCLLVNGSILKESCGSSSNAQERYKTVKALLTGHLEELKAQVTQLEVVVSDATDDVDTINGVIV